MDYLRVYCHHPDSSRIGKFTVLIKCVVLYQDFLCNGEEKKHVCNCQDAFSPSMANNRETLLGGGWQDQFGCTGNEEREREASRTVFALSSPCQQKPKTTWKGSWKAMESRTQTNLNKLFSEKDFQWSL